LLGVLLIPAGVEALVVALEFGDAHPVGEPVLFGQVSDSSEDLGRLLYGVEAEDADASLPWLVEAEDVLDKGGFARAVFADKAENSAFAEGDVDVIEGLFGAEVVGKVLYF